MKCQNPVRLFQKALKNHVLIKANYHGRKAGEPMEGDPWRGVGELAEEVGEVATDMARQRPYGAVAECLDVAHSALLLAIKLDPDGEILRHLIQSQKSVMKARKIR